MHVRRSVCKNFSEMMKNLSIKKDETQKVGKQGSEGSASRTEPET